MKILLLSGGIESTCLAKTWKPDVCLTINYGQIPAEGEIRAAKNVAKFFAAPHEVLDINAASLGSGQMAGKPRIKQATIPELWPFRNQFLITLAAMRFVGSKRVKIAIGSAKGDASHKDGTKKFVDAMRTVLIMQEGKVDFVAPAIEKTSLELMRLSKLSPDVFDLTFSCFVSEYPCGQCRGCIKNEFLRARYFDENPTYHS